MDTTLSLSQKMNCLTLTIRILRDAKFLSLDLFDDCDRICAFNVQHSLLGLTYEIKEVLHLDPDLFDMRADIRKIDKNIKLNNYSMIVESVTSLLIDLSALDIAVVALLY